MRLSNLFVAMVAVVPLVESCASSDAPMQPLQELPTMKVTRGDAVINTDFAAEIESRRVIEIRSRATGYVSEIAVKEGALVRKGQTIVQIDPDQYAQAVNMAQSMVLSAKANVQNAELEIEKLTPLVEKNIVSGFQLQTAQSNLASAKAGLKQAEASLQDARINLSYTTITSPVSGVIGKIDIYPGSLLQAGGFITDVSESGDVFAYFAFDEKKLMELMGQKEGGTIHDRVAELPEVEFIMVDGSVYPQKGRLEVASGLVNKGTGSVQLKGVFPNKAGVLRSGSTGKVRIPLHYENVLVVPQKATFELQDKKMVYVVGADSVVHSKKIDVTGQTGLDYTVGGGIDEGDVIVVEGIRRLREGMKIAPVGGADVR
ncbi:MAG: efflux RND transporter periplasmic adaptor subunit [Rikenellaceae bacterium]|nr:efflux RND transporter periplasmic adaptor subunit [Rikenellaceae bacterium]